MRHENCMKTKMLCGRFQITSSPIEIIVSAAKEAPPVDFTKG